MEILDSLGIDFRVLIIQAGLFLIFYFIVRRFLFGKVLSDIDDREKDWQKLQNEVESKENLLNELSSNLQSKKENLDREVLADMQRTVKEATNKRNIVLSNTREEIENMLIKARQEIKEEKEQALKDLTPHIHNIAESIKKKVVENLE